jgi:farnesyl diphosphate synthase
MDAINDALILESFLVYVLRTHFRNDPNPAVRAHYVPLLELFQDVSLQTQMGQMLDLLSQPQVRPLFLVLVCVCEHAMFDCSNHE